MQSLKDRMTGFLKNIAQFLSRPVFTVFFLCITLLVFLFHTLNYHFIVDDYYYLFATRLKSSYLESAKFLCLTWNGRWFSNVLSSVVFGSLGYKSYLYWYVQLSQFFLFLISVSFFFNSLFSNFGNKKMKLFQSLHIGTFFTCLFYWFYFDSRVEVWYWEASCLVHLVCLICIFFLYGIIFKSKFYAPLKIILVVLLSLFIGGLSETFAFACVIISFYQIIRNRKQENSFFIFHTLTIIFIGISFAVDYCSPGTNIRIHNQPIPEIGVGFKNFVYTFYLQLIKVKHLPFKAVGLFLLWPLALLISKNVGKNIFTNFNLTKLDYLIVGVIIFENTFIPAYFTSIEAPDRVFALNWLLVLLLLLNYFLKNKSKLTSS